MDPQATPKKKPYLLIGGIVLILLIGIFFFVASGTKQLQPQKTAQQTPTTMPLPKEVAVELTNDGFTPEEVTIEAGSAVRWTNTSSAARATVNSDDHPTHKRFPELNLGEFQKGSTLVHIFTTPGTYTYHNHFSPKQTGTVIVK